VGWHAGDPGSILGSDGLFAFACTCIPQRFESALAEILRYIKPSFKKTLRRSGKRLLASDKEGARFKPKSMHLTSLIYLSLLLFNTCNKRVFPSVKYIDIDMT
jgi:hypothetical protein